MSTRGPGKLTVVATLSPAYFAERQSANSPRRLRRGRRRPSTVVVPSRPTRLSATYRGSGRRVQRCLPGHPKRRLIAAVFLLRARQISAQKHSFCTMMSAPYRRFLNQ